MENDLKNTKYLDKIEKRFYGDNKMFLLTDKELEDEFVNVLVLKERTDSNGDLQKKYVEEKKIRDPQRSIYSRLSKENILKKTKSTKLGLYKNLL